MFTDEKYVAIIWPIHGTYAAFISYKVSLVYILNVTACVIEATGKVQDISAVLNGV